MKKLLLISICFLSILGCVENKETLIINKDGSLTATIELKGDKEDLLNGIDIPKGKIWEIKQWEKKEKDKETYYYVAKSNFKNIKDYAENTKTKQEDLKIENSLEIKKVGNKKYYYFKRVYKARNFGKYIYLKEKYIDKKLEKLVSDKGLYNLKKEEQEAFLKGLAMFEIKKKILMVFDALGKAMIDLDFPFSLTEKTINSLEKEYYKVVTPKNIKALLELSKEKQAKKIEEIKIELEDILVKIIKANFKKYQGIKKYIDGVKLNFALTEDINDDKFIIEVSMPGKIILSNGIIEKNKTLWAFGGKDLINRDIPLEAVSVLEE